MSDNLDNLLVEAFAKNLFQDNDEDIEEGEVDKEEGEIDSGDDDKTDRKDSKSERHKHKKSKLKSKNKSNVESKSISKKLVKKSSKICSKISSKVSVKNNTKTKDKNSPNGKKSKKENSKHKKSKSGAKSDKIKHKKSDENDSEVMKLLLSKHFKSYADIEFKEEPMSPERERKKHSKHKSNKKENGRHEKSDRHSDRKKEHKKSKYYDDYYEKQKDSYYSTRSSTTHEDFFYGSYYEGSASVPSDRCRSIYSRPLSPLWDFDSRGRSRSRSPLDYTGDTRSLSPTCRYYALHASRSPGDNYRRHHRRSISPGGRSRRSCSVSSRRSVDRIDKQKLLEIARINLVKMIEKGDLPKGTDIAKLKLRHLRELTTQKSVQQWTEFCRAISALESAAADDSDLELDFDSDDDTRSVASELISIRHPFKVNERKDIQIRVRGFPQLPSRSAKEMAIELREQFPVSSGNQHRRKELDWTEIEPMPPPALPAPKPKTKKIETKLTEILNTPTNIPEETLAYKIIVPTTETITTTATSNAIASSSQMTANTAIETNDRQCPSPIVDTSLTNTTSASVSASTSISSSTLSSTLASVIPHTSSLAEIVGQPKPAEPQPEPEPKSKDSVFAQSSMPIDIGSVMAQRLSAIRKLEEDPYNVVALKQKYQADQMVDTLDITHSDFTSDASLASALAFRYDAQPLRMDPGFGLFCHRS